MGGCRLCPRLCGVNRVNAATGFCGAGHHASVSYAMVHMWEEPCLSGSRGSGAIFFSGCALGCAFCQNCAISRRAEGTVLDDAGLAALLKRVEDTGVHNINLVNPAHHQYAILRALDIYKPGIPVVWNSGGYELPASVRALKGYVDIFLPDLKFMDSAAAARYANAPDYPERAREALKTMLEVAGACVLDDVGMLCSGVLVRHLALPGHTASAVKAMAFIRHELPGAGLSLMTQYIPMGDAARFPEIDRRLTRSECARLEAAFLNGAPGVAYLQEPDSADAAYVPPFGGASPIALG